MTTRNTTYYEILHSLKGRIRLARERVVRALNNELVLVYWEIGNSILQQQHEEGWGTKVIERLAIDLKIEFPSMKGLSLRNIQNMRAFAEAYPEFVQEPVAKLQDSDNQSVIIVQQLIAQLPWGHHLLLLRRLKTTEERIFYLKKAVENGWSRNMLLQQIDNKLQQRQGNAITNFNITLPKIQSDLAEEALKNPYIFDFLGVTDEIQEKELEKALIEHLKKFMRELGRGFAYVGNQYNLQVEGDEFYLDLLFFNYVLDCFVVFELKMGEFKPEFSGKLNFYINAIDEQVKLARHKPTIGVLLCKTPNETVVKYSLKGIDTPIGVAGYEFTNALPKELKSEMPTVQELEEEIEKEISEFKQQQQPVQARLELMKQRLKGIKTEEIQTQATYSILKKLFHDCCRPLYQKIIDAMKTFDEDFQDAMMVWTCNGKSFVNLAQLDEFVDNEEEFRKINQLTFDYNLYGFKKGGANNFSAHLKLNFDIQNYWYGFSDGYKHGADQILKKVYHQSLALPEQQQIIDYLLDSILDRVDWMLAVLKEKEEKDNQIM